MYIKKKRSRNEWFPDVQTIICIKVNESFFKLYYKVLPQKESWIEIWDCNMSQLRITGQKQKQNSG